jgi:methionyl aminopeptidase
VNVNKGLVHGIPKKEVVFKKGDVVSVDVGIFFKGFHTDTSISVGIDVEGETKKFLETGERALKDAISQVKIGNRIFDISKTIQEVVSSGGYSPIRALVGHGVGKELHEEPQIPCFLPGRVEDSPKLEEGMVLAIEVMYAFGEPEVVYDEDGWTISTQDGKISALFEDTVAVTKQGPIVLTA